MWRGLIRRHVMPMRLYSEAKGGQILTNQKTLARSDNAVQAEPLGEFTLKGITHPVPLFNVTAFRMNS